MAKLILLSSCIIAVVADMLVVWWAKQESHNHWFWIVGLILINIAQVIWMISMRKGIESANAITFYALFTTVGCSFLGFYIFHEHLSHLNIAGLVLGLISIIMISI